MDAVSRTPVPANEPVRQYQPGSHERAVLESKIKELAGQRAELTMTIGGNQQMAAGQLVDVVQPHNKAHVLGQLGNATNVDLASNSTPWLYCGAARFQPLPTVEVDSPRTRQEL